MTLATDHSRRVRAAIRAEIWQLSRRARQIPRTHPTRFRAEQELARLSAQLSELEQRIIATRLSHQASPLTDEAPPVAAFHEQTAALAEMHLFSVFNGADSWLDLGLNNSLARRREMTLPSALETATPVFVTRIFIPEIAKAPEALIPAAASKQKQQAAARIKLPKWTPPRVSIGAVLDGPSRALHGIAAGFDRRRIAMAGMVRSATSAAAQSARRTRSLLLQSARTTGAKAAALSAAAYRVPARAVRSTGAALDRRRIAIARMVRSAASATGQRARLARSLLLQSARTTRTKAAALSTAAINAAKRGARHAGAALNVCRLAVTQHYARARTPVPRIISRLGGRARDLLIAVRSRPDRFY